MTEGDSRPGGESAGEGPGFSSASVQLDREQRICNAEPRLLAWLGLTLDQVRGRGHGDMFEAGLAARLSQGDQLAMAGEAAQPQVEWLAGAGSPHPLPFMVSRAVLTDVDGAVTGVMLRLRLLWRDDVVHRTLNFLATADAGSGGEFFAALARWLASELRADLVRIDRWTLDPDRAHNLALHIAGQPNSGGIPAPGLAHDELLPGRDLRIVPVGLAEICPEDEHVKLLGAQSFAGAQLRVRDTSVGLVSMFFKRTLDATEQARIEVLLRVVAVRAAGEIDRLDHLRALRVSEERFRSMAELSQDWYWEQDTELRYVSLSGGAMPANAVLSMGWRRWDHPNVVDRDDPSWEIHRAQLARHEPFSNFEYQVRGDDGAIRWVSVSGMPMFDDNGEFRGYRGTARDLTVFRQAEQALRAQRDLLQSMIDAIPHPFMLKDLDSRYLMVNRANLNLLGLPQHQVIGRRAPDMQEPAVAALHERMDAEVRVDTKGEVQYDAPFTRPSGERRMHRIFKTVHRGPDGEVMGVIGMSMDITDQLTAEAAVKASETRFRDLTELSADWYWEQDSQFRFTYLAGELRGKTGISTQDHLGRTRWEMPALNLDEVAWRRHRETLARHEPFRDFQMRRPDADGRQHWVSISGKPIFDSAGTFVGYRGIGRDITVQKQALEQAQKAQAEVKSLLGDADRSRRVLLSVVEDQKRAEDKLLQANTLMELVLENLPCGLAVFDASMRLTRSNQQFRRLLDIPEQMLGISQVHMQDLLRLDPRHEGDDEAIANAMVGQVLETARSGQPLAFERVRDNGAHLEIRGVPLPGGGLVCTFIDITDRKQAELTRASLEAQLRESQKMEAMGTLAGGIAHDFNNIIAAILGNAALARKDLEAGEVGHARVSVEEIGRAASRAKNLVQQILTFSRRESQQMHGQALQPLVEESLALLRATLPASVSLKAVLADEPVYASVNATQFEQVLMNLCTNAWHALPAIGGRINVELCRMHRVAPGAPIGAPPAEYANLRVSDNGCGMDGATLERIFEPFFTTKPVDRGTGLGLAVVHGIVRQHNGFIDVQSEPGGGTTVDVLLPIAPAPEPGVQDSPHVATSVASLRGQRHVMYVDDDEAMVFLIQRMLSDMGYQVSTHASGEEALERLAASVHDLDLVVTDFNMPGASGLDVAAAVARLRPELPVVITSGYITEELRTRAGEVGAWQLISKPDTIDELCDIVRNLLEAEAEPGAAAAGLKPEREDPA